MKRKPYRFLLYLGLRLVKELVRAIPRRPALAIAEGVGKTAFLVARRERERTLAHLRMVYGKEKSETELETLGKNVFIHFARAAVDVLRLPELVQAGLEEFVDGKESLFILDQALSEGRGVILLTAHLGNWELMGAFLRTQGYRGAVVARRLYYERFDREIVNLRKEVDLNTIYQDAPPREFLNVLHQNEILGVLADQDIDRFEGIFVPFFGLPAYTLTAPVKLALATGAPIVPTFVLRNGDRYRLFMEEPIRVELKGTKEEMIEEYTARWSRVVEEKIRAFPEQWAWMHRRWKTQPEGVQIKETAGCSSND